MSLVAPVEDGKIVSTTSSSSLSTTSSSSTGMDKEAFLQLLVAQMKYQDPLEPTSNTEYISQYAQFSQVESMQNMSSTMELQRASALVGETVYVKTTSSSGETGYVQGVVDYVTFEGGKAYVYINESGYALDDVETIVDSTYMEAYELATELVTSINKLPNIAVLDLSDAETVDKLNETYTNMTEYQKTFVAKEKAETLQKYVDRIAELRALAEENAKTEEDETTAGDTDTDADVEEA